MTTARNPNLSIFKTLLSLNTGRGCSVVETNTGTSYLAGDELSQLEVRVRIYGKRKKMYNKTDAAIAILNNLADLIKDDAHKNNYTKSAASTFLAAKEEVKDKIQELSERFLGQYKILVDEDNDAAHSGMMGIDIRDKQGIAPRVDASPFGVNDGELIAALAKYETTRGKYKEIDDLMKIFNDFDQKLATLSRISPASPEDILTEFNFNPWDLSRAGKPSLNELSLAVIARKQLVKEYIDAFDNYLPTDAVEKQKKMDTFVNPNKQSGESVGANWPIGRSGMDYIHGYTEAELQSQTLQLHNSSAAQAAQLGGLTTAKAAYRNLFGSAPNVEGQITSLTSAADVIKAQAERTELIQKLTDYSPLGTNFTNKSDKELKLELDTAKNIFIAYYQEYKAQPDITFQQNSKLDNILALTGKRRDLNQRADAIMSSVLVDLLTTVVGDDNTKYEAAIVQREGAVKAFKEIGGEYNNPTYKDLSDAQLKTEYDARKLIIDRVEDSYKNQRDVLDAMKKKKNSEVQLDLNARYTLLQDIGNRNLNPNGGSELKSDQVLRDLIQSNDDQYNKLVSEITLAMGTPFVGNAPANTPPLKDLESQFKKLSDERQLLLQEANTILDTSSELKINGKALGKVVDDLQTMSNADIDSKLKQIKAIAKGTSQANAWGTAISAIEASVAALGQLINSIDMSDLQKAAGTALGYRKGLDGYLDDLDQDEVDINTDDSLSASTRVKLQENVARVRQMIADEKNKLGTKDQEIKDEAAKAANTQASAVFVQQYIAEIDSQDVQGSNLVGDLNVTYETKTSYAIGMLQDLLDAEMSRLKNLDAQKGQESNDFVAKLDELRIGVKDVFDPGEEVSIMIQSLSNFDTPDGGEITGQSSDSQKTMFSKSVKMGSKSINLTGSAQAPLKSIELGWEEVDKTDSLFISSWARVVPNRDTPESITMLKTMGLEWLTEPLYVDMLDRKRVFNYNGFLREYQQLLNGDNTVDYTKRAEYTDDQGVPIRCSILLPSNTSLGGIFGVPVDLVTVGVAGTKPIEYLAAPSIGGLLTEIRKTLIEAGVSQKTRSFPTRDERNDINDILKAFFISDGKGVKATPASDPIDITDDATFGDEEAWAKVLKAEADGTASSIRFLTPGSAAKLAYDSGFIERACTEAAFGFIQEELLNVAKVKLRIHRVQPYGKMTTLGAGSKKGTPYLCLQCANQNNYCVLIKDNRSPVFDFLDISRRLYIFNKDGKKLEEHNDGMKVAAAVAGTTPVASTLLDTDDEDVSNFRFIPNI